MMFRAVLALGAALLLSSCGGGGGSSAPVITTPAPSNGIPPSASVANICTAEGQKLFTRSYMHENYLWYAEIPQRDPAAYATVSDYFYSLRTPQLDATGAAKDRFSFITTAADADSLLTGSNIGYGVRWESDSLGRTRVAYLEPGSPAANAGMQRGGELVSTASPSPDWYPNGPASITFSYRATPAAATTSITLQAAPVQEDPLPLTQTLTTSGGRKVAYLVFNAHTQGAQDRLIPALGAAQSAGVQDVVLDMRYNGGGYLYTALSLSSMLTSPAADNRVFEQLRYNNKRNAQTNASAMRFSGNVLVSESQSPAGTALPRLAFPRVYVLTTENTCSASESVINGLRGVGVNVVLVGRATCGKPYGFSRADNCGLAYFPIEFQGVNDVGFGDYAHGFAPTCAAADDFEHPLGSTAERLLATALHHVDNGTCPAQPLAAPHSARAPAMSTARMPVRGKIVLYPK